MYKAIQFSIAEKIVSEWLGKEIQFPIDAQNIKVLTIFTGKYLVVPEIFLLSVSLSLSLLFLRARKLINIFKSTIAACLFFRDRLLFFKPLPRPLPIRKGRDT
jgi:hypothetical protein